MPVAFCVHPFLDTLALDTREACIYAYGSTVEGISRAGDRMTIRISR